MGCRPFLKTFLFSNYVRLRSQSAGGVQPNLNLGLVREIAVPLPPLAEQAEIVAEVDRRLSVADAAETQIEHALQRAARLRQAILKRAFEGKLVPQDPTGEPLPKPSMDSRASMKPAVRGRTANGKEPRTPAKRPASAST